MRATYRLQLGPGLGFDDARALVPYLRDLGVSHLYLSPSLQARRRLDARLRRHRPAAHLGRPRRRGGLPRAGAARGLDVLLDIVPNHMAASDENPFWADEALRERFFDIDPETGRHRRFFSIDELAGVRVGGPGGLRGHPRPGAAPGGGGRSSTACASTTPTASPTRPATCAG